MRINLKIGRQLISSNHKPVVYDDKSEDEVTARGRIQSMDNAVQTFFAELNRLPIDQSEIDPYTDFSPTSNYTYSFTYLHTGICYMQATTSYSTLHSFTLTESFYNGYPESIVCKKNTPGTPPSNVSDYNSTLSCHLDATQN